MRPLAEFPAELRRRIRFVLTDIDDTLTTNGRLSAAAYAALERLTANGLRLIPVTGRPAGWCDLIARFWPVDAVVGENGAFWFRYDHQRRVMTRQFWLEEAERAEARRKLGRLAMEIPAQVPGARVATDQPYRLADLAIDFAEDTGPLPLADAERIAALFRAAGAEARVSSIHVNGWFGNWDKLAMTRRLFAEAFDADLDRSRDEIVFIGDSPNDAPMFRFFPNAVGVANIHPFLDRIETKPAYVTDKPAGAGFVEFAEMLRS